MQTVFSRSFTLLSKCFLLLLHSLSENFPNCYIEGSVKGVHQFAVRKWRHAIFINTNKRSDVIQEKTKKRQTVSKKTICLNIFPHTPRRDKNNILLSSPFISRLSLNPDIALPRTPRALMLLH